MDNEKTKRVLMLANHIFYTHDTIRKTEKIFQNNMDTAGEDKKYGLKGRHIRFSYGLIFGHKLCEKRLYVFK